MSEQLAPEQVEAIDTSVRLACLRKDIAILEAEPETPRMIEMLEVLWEREAELADELHTRLLAFL